MGTSDYDTNTSHQKREKRDNTYPPGFLAAMRLNAIQRGVKWKDTYELTGKFTG